MANKTPKIKKNKILGGGEPNLRSKFGAKEFYFSLFLGFFLAVFLLLTAIPASAQSFLEGIVPCGTSYTGNTPCTVCHFYVLLKNIIDFLLLTSASLATLMTVYIGFLFLFSGGSQKTIQDAKGKLRLLVWGIGWVLGSWLVLNTIVNYFADSSVFPKPWNKISCEISKSSIKENTTTSTSQQLPLILQECTNCVPLAVPVKPGACESSAKGQICKINNSLNDKLTILNKSFIGDGKLSYWHVTEAFPPTVTHQNPCHQNGTCVDANLKGSSAGNDQEIKYFINKAKAAGLNPIYEVESNSRRDKLIELGVPRENILSLPPKNNIPQIKGEHFSIYQTAQSLK